MIEEFSSNKRDQFGEDCVICCSGSYICAVDGLLDRLECSVCDDQVDRYMTKRELLEHTYEIMEKVFSEDEE